MPEASTLQVVLAGLVLVAACVALAALARRLGSRATPPAETDLSLASEDFRAATIGRLRCLSAAERSEADADAWRREALMYAERIDRLAAYIGVRQSPVTPPAVPVAPMPESFAAQLGAASMAERERGHRPDGPHTGGVVQENTGAPS